MGPASSGIRPRLGTEGELHGGIEPRKVTWRPFQLAAPSATRATWRFASRLANLPGVQLRRPGHQTTAQFALTVNSHQLAVSVQRFDSVLLAFTCEARDNTDIQTVAVTSQLLWLHRG